MFTCQDRGYRVVPLLYSEWQTQQDAGQTEIYLQGKLVNAGVIAKCDQIPSERSVSQKLDSQLSVPLEEEEDLGAFVDALEDDLMPENEVTAARDEAASSAQVQSPTADTSL